MVAVPFPVVGQSGAGDVFEALLGYQHRIAEMLRTHYGLRLTPLVFETRDVLSPRWIRLPYSLVAGEEFGKILARRHEIAHAVRKDFCEVSLDAEALWVAIPRKEKEAETVYLRDFLHAHPQPNLFLGGLYVALGVDMKNRQVISDLAQAPHVLVVGASGAGKSVFLNVLVTSLAYWYPHRLVKLILCDGKGGRRPTGKPGFAIFGTAGMAERLEHLSPFPVLTETSEMVEAINWLVHLMEKRQREGASVWPRYVLVIDELADVLAMGGPAIEDLLQRLSWRGRSAGIHVIAATVKADKDSLGKLPSLFKKRATMSVVRASDAYMATNVGGSGAHLLLMKGDMLFGSGDRHEHIQSYLVEDPDILALLKARNRFRQVPISLTPADFTVPLPGASSGPVPVFNPRRTGRPLSDITSAEVVLAKEYFQQNGEWPSQRFVASGSLTGTSMGNPRAKRLLEAAQVEEES